MDSNEVLGLLSAGESQHVEFKQMIAGEKSLARDLSAFANSGGGVMLIGVDDLGSVVGLTATAARLASSQVSTVAGALLPQPVDVDIVEIYGRYVVVVAVPAIADPTGPVMTADGLVHRRIGTSIKVRNLVPSRSLSVSKEPLSLLRKKLFVAMSFHFEEEPALVDYYEAIKRAVLATRLPIDIQRVDLIEGDYEIMERTEQEIRGADIVLADYTLGSSNVFYEAGMAKALGKRIIRCARKGTDLPFDVRQYRTHVYSNATQLEAQLVEAIDNAYYGR